MHAVILAGGKGTRLKPYTAIIPKPLVPVGDKAILEILLLRLKKSGITNVHICLNHSADLIRAFFGEGEKIGLTISYTKEDIPLGTVAPIKLVKDLPDDFLVMNGDLLTDLNFLDLYNMHVSRNSMLTIAAFQRKLQIDFGVLDTDDSTWELSAFIEKPVYNYNVSMGIYAMQRAILEMIPDNTPFGFDNLLHMLLGEKIKVHVFPYQGYWLDIGRPEDYDKANDDIRLINSFL